MELVENIAPMPGQTLTITTDMNNLSEIAKAISSETRQKILKLLNQEPMDVSRLAQELQQTEANISAQIQILQKAHLVTSHYEPGSHGVRKICHLQFSKIVINLF